MSNPRPWPVQQIELQRDILAAVENLHQVNKILLIALTGIFIMQVGVMISLWAR